MNPVLILTRNNLDLTKRCVESVRNQDIPTRVYIGDNGSTDETKEWLMTWPEHTWWSWDENIGVSSGWNIGLGCLFEHPEVNSVLVVGNDTSLPPFFYRELLSYPQPFVTGFAVESFDDLREPTERRTENHPDFSAFLMRRTFWEKVGPFDESMVMYAQDCCMHVRGHRAGMEMVKVPVPFYHERSSTLRLAPPEEKYQIQEQANRDRATFRAKYGCIPGEPAYEDLFK
jgi:GT2 family glycosyltransferase